MKITRDKRLKEIKIFKPGSFKDFRGEIWTNWEKNISKTSISTSQNLQNQKKCFCEVSMGIKNHGN